MVLIFCCYAVFLQVASVTLPQMSYLSDDSYWVQMLIIKYICLAVFQVNMTLTRPMYSALSEGGHANPKLTEQRQLGGRSSSWINCTDPWMAKTSKTDQAYYPFQDITWLFIAWVRYTKVVLTSLWHDLDLDLWKVRLTAGSLIMLLLFMGNIFGKKKRKQDLINNLFSFKNVPLLCQTFSPEINIDRTCSLLSGC